MEELYSDDLAGLLVERAVDHSHAALANLPLQNEATGESASVGRQSSLDGMCGRVPQT